MEIHPDWGTLDSDLDRIGFCGGSVTVDGHAVGGAAELMASLRSAELSEAQIKMVLANIRNVMETAMMTKSLPDIAKPKGYPKNYRPKLDIRPKEPMICHLRWL